MIAVEWLLAKEGLKSPDAPNGHHVKTTDPDVVRRHVKSGGNPARTGRFQATMDWDVEEARLALFAKLGPLPLHVRTGSGKFHSYMEADPTLPGSIRGLDGDVIGQIRRTSNEYVLCPPARVNSPTHTGPYTWLIPPPHDLQPLPDIWREHLKTTEAEYGASGVGGRFEIPEEILEGNRHREIFRWTRSWKASRLTLDDAIEILRLANNSIIHPPLDDEELVRHVTRSWHQADRREFIR